MKKIIITILIALSWISTANAQSFPQGWLFTNRGNIIESSTTLTVRTITATSTVSSSIFPYASTTVTSATSLCLTGDLPCRTSWPSGGTGGGAYPFTPTVNYGVNNQATTGIAWFQNGLNASSTSHFVYASTTAVSATSLCLVGDICRTTWPTGGSGTGWATSSADTTSIYSTAPGNVGIGTTSPYSKLSVAGTIVGRNFVGTTTTATSTLAGALSVGWGSPYAYLLVSTSTDVAPKYGQLRQTLIDAGGSTNDYMSINVYNNSTAPCASADFTANNDLADITTDFIDIGRTGSGWTGVGCSSALTGVPANSGYIFDPTGSISMLLGDSTKYFAWFKGYGVADRIMTLLGNGNLGVGTSSPYERLSVAGKVVAQSFTATSTTNPSTFGGKVGIGTTNPGAQLEVSASTPSIGLIDTGGTNELYYGINSSFGGGTIHYGTFSINRDPGTGTFKNTGRAGAQINFESAVSNADIAFYTSTLNNVTPSDRMRILGNGNVGISTSTPGQRLSVAGNILGNTIIGTNFVATSTTESSRFNGKIGIGTSTPSQMLDVNGNINIENANGIIMKDTVTGSCYLVRVTSGAIALTANPCQ